MIITASVHNYMIEYLEKQGYVVDYSPQVSYADLQKRIGEATGLIVTTRITVDKTMLEMASIIEMDRQIGKWNGTDRYCLR